MTKTETTNTFSQEIKDHPLFMSIDEEIDAKEKEFTSETPQDSVVNELHYLSETVQQQFAGFTFMANSVNFHLENKMKLTKKRRMQTIYLHNSAIIDDKLLVFSGYTNITDDTYELFYLDLSTSFDNDNPTWALIPEGSLPIYTYRSTTVLSLDNSTIYLYGGFMRDKNTLDYNYSNLVYTYDYLTSTWSTPKIGDDSVPPPRQDMRGVIDDSGIIYIFGGFNATNLTSFSGRLFNDMNALNTVSNTWTTLIISGNIPNLCDQYAANILPDGIIVYFGGVEQVSVGANFTLANMNKIKLFDTNTYEWSRMDATGDEIDPRMYFSSVLTQDGYIIIFGGCTYSATGTSFSSVFPKLATLDTNKDIFEWSIPSDSEVNSPPSIYGHTANLYNDFMIITFGYDADTQLYSSSSQVYLYNIKSNKWVTTFSPTENKPTLTTTIATAPVYAPKPKKDFKLLAIGLGLSTSFSSVFPKLATLDTNKDIFEWSIPSDSEVNSPPSIYGHTANLYNDFMIITFGYDADTQLYSSSSQVYLYNIKSNKWVTTFSPTENKPTLTTTIATAPVYAPKPKKDFKLLAIGLGLSAVFLISCIFISIFVVRRIRQTNDNDVKQTSDNDAKPTSDNDVKQTSDNDDLRNTIREGCSMPQRIETALDAKKGPRKY
ncbi:hypothetical protein Glove_109g244 [Diversispora epigaea]|uniref:Uncharacterized protein n=1 Tax=Diversispora epigaea TaxID=1348612 RepID=A0A397JBE2_9GLOM|nr:hypothetical protein Glove_109g244 [Diversispora epigaea]